MKSDIWRSRLQYFREYHDGLGFAPTGRIHIAEDTAIWRMLAAVPLPSPDQQFELHLVVYMVAEDISCLTIMVEVKDALAVRLKITERLAL